MKAATNNKIFISYNRKDEVFALKLAKDLNQHEIPTWIDQLDIPPGSRWDDEIANALEVSNILLVIMSPAGAESTNLADEVTYAIQRNLRVIPILVSDCKIPLRLIRFQQIDFRNNYADAFESLIGFLLDDPRVNTLKNAPTTPGPHKTNPLIKINFKLLVGIFIGITLVIILVKIFVFNKSVEPSISAKPTDTSHSSIPIDSSNNLKSIDTIIPQKDTQSSPQKDDKIPVKPIPKFEISKPNLTNFIDKTKVYNTVEILPTFKGGDIAMTKFISNNLVYPKAAIIKNIEGKVIVRFIVRFDGTLTDIKNLSGVKLGYGCEEAAVEVIKKMPKWIPGKQNGKFVSTYMNLPIKFKLN